MKNLFGIALVLAAASTASANPAQYAISISPQMARWSVNSFIAKEAYGGVQDHHQNYPCFIRKEDTIQRYVVQIIGADLKRVLAEFEIPSNRFPTTYMDGPVHIIGVLEANGEVRRIKLAPSADQKYVTVTIISEGRLGYSENYCRIER